MPAQLFGRLEQGPVDPRPRQRHRRLPGGDPLPLQRGQGQGRGQGLTQGRGAHALQPRRLQQRPARKSLLRQHPPHPRPAQQLGRTFQPALQLPLCQRVRCGYPRPQHGHARQLRPFQYRPAPPPVLPHQPAHHSPSPRDKDMRAAMGYDRPFLQKLYLALPQLFISLPAPGSARRSASGIMGTVRKTKNRICIGGKSE